VRRGGAVIIKKALSTQPLHSHAGPCTHSAILTSSHARLEPHYTFNFINYLDSARLDFLINNVIELRFGECLRHVGVFLYPLSVCGVEIMCVLSHVERDYGDTCVYFLCAKAYDD
jgi:hypothetical protein